MEQIDINNLAPGVLVGLTIALIWSAVWEAIALWKAARRGDTAWYIILLLLNTVGILEIIYIYLIAKEKK